MMVYENGPFRMIDEGIVPLHRPIEVKRPQVDTGWLRPGDVEKLNVQSTPADVRRVFYKERCGNISGSHTTVVFHLRTYGADSLSGMMIQSDRSGMPVWQRHLDVPDREYAVRFNAFADYLDTATYDRADIGSNTGTAITMPKLQHTNFRVTPHEASTVEITQLADQRFRGLFAENVVGQQVARNLQARVPYLDGVESIIFPDSAEVGSQGTVVWMTTDRLATTLRRPQLVGFFKELHQAWDASYEGTDVDAQYRCGGIDIGEAKGKGYVAVHAAVQFGPMITGMIPGLGIALSEPVKATPAEERAYFLGTMKLGLQLTGDRARYHQMQDLWQRRNMN